MKCQRGSGQAACREGCGHDGQLLVGLLREVLGHVGQPGRNGLHDGSRGLTLGHTDQRHPGGVAARAPGRRCDALAEPGEALADAAAVHAVSPSSSSSARVSSRGRPITFVSLPSTRVTKRRPSPWSAYAPALSRLSPVAT